MLIAYWKEYKKKKNSTAHPALNTGIRLTVDVTESCSENNPVLIINQNIHDIQYVFSNSWHRYYFVTEVTHDEGRTFVSLSVDPLATYKEGIGATRAFVTRSASKVNPNLVDTLYPVEPKANYIERLKDSPFDSFNYIVQYAGADGIHTVNLTSLQFELLCKALWSTWGSINGINDVIKNVLDPSQYILSVHKSYTSMPFWHVNHLDYMTLGDMNLKVVDVVNFIDEADGWTSINVQVPKHPQATTYPYAKSEPFSSYSIRIPGIGWVPLDANALTDATEVQVFFRAEPFKGTMVAQVNVATNTIASASGVVTSPWALGSSQVSIGGMLGTVAGVAGTAMTGGLAGIAGGLVAGATGMANNTPTVTVNGGTAGAVGIAEPCVLQLKYYEVPTPDTQNQGRLYMASDLISNHTGFVQCSKGTFTGGFTSTERDMVNNYMVGGFYYE